MLKMRGRWTTANVSGRKIPLLPTLHPAFLLRQPAQKRLAWRDLLTLRQALDAH
jgi:DNA polymerase